MTTVIRQKVCLAQELYIDVPRERNIWDAEGKGGLNPRERDKTYKWLQTGACRLEMAPEGARRGAGWSQGPCWLRAGFPLEQQQGEVMDA